MRKTTGNETDIAKQLSIKLLRFGFLMFILALLFGCWLWFGYNLSGQWLSIKLSLVTVLLLYFSISGWFVYNATQHQKFISGLAMRLFNEGALILVLPIIYLAVSKGA